MTSPTTSLIWKEGSLTAALYRRYSGEVHRYLRRRLRDNRAAEDGVQQVFLQIWRREVAGALEADAAGYIFVSAKNYVRQCRRAGASRIEISESPAATESAHDGPGVEEAVHFQRLLATAVDGVGTLPRATQTIFLLRFAKGYTHSEIAAELGITTRTVERHMARALEVVRATLNGKYP